MSKTNTHLNYTALTVTIPADSAAHNLYDLIAAAYASLPVPVGANATDVPSTKGRTMTIQNDPDANTASVCLGDSNVSATNMGYKLAQGGSITLQNVHDETLPIGQYYAFAPTSAVKLNVQLLRS